MQSKELVAAGRQLERLGLSYGLITIFGEATRIMLGKNIGAGLDRLCAEFSESDPEVTAVKNALATALKSAVANMREERDYSSANVGRFLGAYLCDVISAQEILRSVSAKISDQAGTE